MTTDTGAPCPFCDPTDDRLFAQNALAIALWDGFPVTSGHALITPRRHIAGWFDTSESERSALFALVDTAKAIIDPVHRPNGYNIGINIGAAAGQTVFHAHIHLIPRFVGDVKDPSGGVRHVIPSKAHYTAAPDSRSISDHGASRCRRFPPRRRPNRSPSWARSHAFCRRADFLPLTGMPCPPEYNSAECGKEPSSSSK